MDRGCPAKGSRPSRPRTGASSTLDATDGVLRTARERDGASALKPVLHSVCMKRTNLVLDEQLLEEATRLSGERTYSRAVERALEEFVKRARARQILDLAGSGLWDGELAVVREDRGVYRTKRRGTR